MGGGGTNEFTLACVRTKGKSERICSTLWDAIGIVCLLALFCLLHLQWIQVAVCQLGMEALEDLGIENKSQKTKVFPPFVLKCESAFHLIYALIGQTRSL